MVGGVSMGQAPFRVVIPLAALAIGFGGYFSGPPATASAQQPAEPLEFNRDIRPILNESCLICHGPNETTRQADLRFDTDDFIGTVVVTGDAEASPLYQRLTTEDRIGRMPPVSSGQSLTDEQIDAVRRWIDGGAEWGAELADADALPMPERVVDFAREVRPILSQNCFTCHGPDEGTRQRGLRLDVAEGPFADRGTFGGAVVIPGNADDSLLIHRVTATEDRVRMPYRLGLNTPVMPGTAEDALSLGEIETLRLWIDQGAEWQSHWAFVPPERPSVPPVADPEWGRNPIDSFVLSSLEAQGLGPAPEADRTTLLRRVTLDLTGLPPSAGDVAAFLNDDSPDAYENAVDRLLGSTAFGERMAVEWLDGARYADSSGYQTDAPRSMWRYRDWVIDAYNSNMPFDQFTIEQLAGDMLPSATLDQRIATAFNRNHSQNGEGGIVPEEFLVENVVDRVSTTGTVWMGLTLGCARCHDHKFDPLSQREFYELFAFFNNVPERGKAFKYGNSPPMITAPTDEQFAELAELDEELAAAREALATLETEAGDAQREWEASLAAAGDVDWVLRDKLLVHHPLDGDIAGVYTSEPVFLSPNVTSDVRGEQEPELAELPVNVKLVDGQPLFVPGRIGEAVSFDGQRFIDAGDIANFTYNDPFSVAAWIHPTAGDGVIVSRALAGDQGERGWGLYLADGKLQVNLSERWQDDGVRVETQDVLPLDEWLHVLMTYDGKRVPASFRVYVNGESVELTPQVDGINNPMRTREPLRIGASGPPPEDSGGTDSAPRFQGLIDDVRVYTQALTPEQAAVVATADSLTEIANLPAADRTAGQAEKLRLAFLDQYASEKIQEAWRAAGDLERKRAELWDNIQTVMVMEEMDPPRDTFLLVRGAYDVPGEQVSPGVPAVLPPLPEGGENNRLAFARWLVEPDHPLTARVTVNRFWQMLFGTGIVKTAENFGLQGEYPSHPDLLDWLATSFIDSGWDVKSILREIVISATYRQASAVTPEQLESDPENRMLARGPRLRLPAQMIRDQALTVAGLLVDQVGGPSVKPYQPEGLWDQASQRYDQSEGNDLYRRSLYTYWKRTLAPPSMLTFDSSTRETCIVRTDRTNTPLQALNLMNDVTYVEAARRVAERMMTEGGATPEERVAFAYRLTTAHRPRPEAHDVLSSAFHDYLERYQADRAAALGLVSVGESPRDETLDIAELASYTMVASMILNLDRTITKD
ncbi:MAG: DUF1553 domain-containing protein [Acidobacteria bacterium]|nr:DUF1553 domain-containing protein [Acidobacteriota bacterium]